MNRVVLRITPVHFSMSTVSCYLSQYDNIDFREGHSLHGASHVFIDSYNLNFWKNRKTEIVSLLLYFYAKNIVKPLVAMSYWTKRTIVKKRIDISPSFIYKRTLPVFGRIDPDEIFAIPLESCSSYLDVSGNTILPVYTRILDLTSMIDSYIEKEVRGLSFALGVMPLKDSLYALSQYVDLCKTKKVVFIGEYYVETS